MGAHPHFDETYDRIQNTRPNDVERVFCQGASNQKVWTTADWMRLCWYR